MQARFGFCTACSACDLSVLSRVTGIKEWAYIEFLYFKVELGFSQGLYFSASDSFLNLGILPCLPAVVSSYKNTLAAFFYKPLSGV